MAVLTGTVGNDTLIAVGGPIDDTIDGGLGADFMRGDDGSDLYFVDDVGDIVQESFEDAVSGNDTVSSSVSYTLTFGIDNLVLTGSAGLTGTGNGLNNTITGNDGSNQLSGLGGNDSLNGGTGFDSDVLLGGEGNDTLNGGVGSDSADGGVGDDYIFAVLGMDTAVGGDGNDTLDTTAFTGSYLVNLQLGTTNFPGESYTELENVISGIGDDTLIGTTGNNLLNGGAGNDALDGGDGNDTLIGGLGSDTLAGSNGNDSIDGGAITDIIGWTDSNLVSFVGSGVGIQVDLATGLALGEGSDTLSNINQVRGSSLADTLSGTSTTLQETLEGGDGFDLLDGRGGLDTASYEYASIGVSVSLLSSQAFVNAADQDTLRSIEALLGSNVDDTLSGGNAASNSLEIFRGNGGSDTIDGGAGVDRVEYLNALQGVVATLGGLADGIASDGTPTLNGQIVGAGTPGAVVGTDKLRNIESLWGSNFADTLSGSAAAVTESFDGRGGDDVIDGNGGIDVVVYRAAPGAVTLVLGLDGADGTATDGWGATDTLRDIEQVIGTAGFSDSITGNELANLLVGGGGNDTLAGGAGSDTLDGGFGVDSLVGGTGGDTYVVDVAGETVSETSTLATEIDTVQAGLTYTLGANLEKLTLTGTSVINGTGNTLANTITGNGAANRLNGATGNDTLSAGAGADTLDGGTGNDSLAGGTGGDIYIVDSAADIVSETSTLATEIDTVQAGVTFTLGLNLEKLTLTGLNATNGTGNILANTITGNTAANRLTGAAGNDTLSAGAGADTLDGGTGNDSLVGGTGGDTYIVNATTDIVSETSTLATEIDTVQAGATFTLGLNVEKLTLTGTSAINGTGNTLANTITGNTAANRLTGNVGNDTLSGGNGADTLDGGSGTDSLVGGSGGDTYIVDSAADIIVETSTVATEIDTVQSAVSRTLAGFLENLTLTGSATNGTGSSVANTIIGNAAANVLAGLAGNDSLNGGSGNDTLDGGVGNDTMVGGTGADTFRFSTTLNGTNNVDLIQSFVAVDDTIRLERAVFTAIGALGALDPNAFRSGSASADQSDRIVYDSATGRIYYDSDGTGFPDDIGGFNEPAILFAQVAPGTSLTAADFVIG